MFHINHIVGPVFHLKLMFWWHSSKELLSRKSKRYLLGHVSIADSIKQRVVLVAWTSLRRNIWTSSPLNKNFRRDLRSLLSTYNLFIVSQFLLGKDPKARLWMQDVPRCWECGSRCPIRWRWHRWQCCWWRFDHRETSCIHRRAFGSFPKRNWDTINKF